MTRYFLDVTRPVLVLCIPKNAVASGITWHLVYKTQIYLAITLKNRRKVQNGLARRTHTSEARFAFVRL